MKNAVIAPPTSALAGGAWAAAVPASSLAGYEITREIGRGGMGIVYLARDTRLDRPVAIKTNSALLSSRGELLARFQREARLLAGLSHPNIATVYALTEHDQGRFLVMEYIEGQTLAERLQAGAMPIDEALSIAAQIAAGVEAAHEAGVIHRDLKPSNIMVTARGQVKVLDFGLARSELREPGSPESGATVEHTVLGTAGYMSPEQACGKPLDRRTDIWSFGCVFYELLTGQRTFRGKTSADIVARILERDPDWSLLPDRTPPRIVELLHRCLTKDASRRQRDIGDARLEIETARARREWTAAHKLGRAADVGRSGAASMPVTHTSVRVPQPLQMRRMHGDARPLLTPDGRTLLFIASEPRPSSESPAATFQPRRDELGVAPGVRRLYRRPLDAAESAPIADTEHAVAALPSADGRSIAFVSAPGGTEQRVVLSTVPVDGSAPPTAVCTLEPSPRLLYSDGTWLSDGDFLFPEYNVARRIYRIAASGEPAPEPLEIAQDPSYDQLYLGPQLPGEEAILATALRFADPFTIDAVLIDLKKKQLTRLVKGAFPTYSRTGHLLFTRDAALLAVPFDIERHQVKGTPATVITGVRTLVGLAMAPFALSPGGTLVYIRGTVLGRRRRLGVLGAGATLDIWPEDPQPLFHSVDVSSDGRRFVTVRESPEGLWEVCGSELDRPRVRSVVRRARQDVFAPVLSPDGETVAFLSRSSAVDEAIGVRAFDRSGEARIVLTQSESGRKIRPRAWTPDGKAIVYVLDEHGRSDLMVLPVEHPQSRHRLVPGDASTRDPAFSPDGRFLAYVADDSGTWQVLVRSWAADRLGPPVDVSTHGGLAPRWSADSRRIYFTSLDGTDVLCAEVTADPRLSVSTPVRAPDLPDIDTRERLGVLSWAPLPDGNFLVMLKGEDEAPADGFELILNWFDELKSKVPLAAP